MLERDIEKLLVSGVKTLEGVAYKFVSPGNAGVPDRIVLLPGGIVEFVELKTSTGKPTSLQLRQAERICRLGCSVHILYGKAGVKQFLEDVEKKVKGNVV